MSFDEVPVKSIGTIGTRRKSKRTTRPTVTISVRTLAQGAPELAGVNVLYLSIADCQAL